MGKNKNRTLIFQYEEKLHLKKILFKICVFLFHNVLSFSNFQKI